MAGSPAVLHNTKNLMNKFREKVMSISETASLIIVTGSVVFVTLQVIRLIYSHLNF